WHDKLVFDLEKLIENNNRRSDTYRDKIDAQDISIKSGSKDHVIGL
ncbi:15675_t:CDS:1, partial [Gigaspora rosea]